MHYIYGFTEAYFGSHSGHLIFPTLRYLNYVRGTTLSSLRDVLAAISELCQRCPAIRRALGCLAVASVGVPVALDHESAPRVLLTDHLGRERCLTCYLKPVRGIIDKGSAYT